MAYDANNIFARLLRGEIPNKTVFENTHALAFHDINPQAPVHVLVIPKGAYVTMTEFAATAPPAELVDFSRAIAEVIRLTNIEASGFRLICNNGEDGVQDVPHLHMHVLGGRPLGRMLSPPRD